MRSVRKRRNSRVGQPVLDVLHMIKPHTLGCLNHLLWLILVEFSCRNSDRDYWFNHSLQCIVKYSEAAKATCESMLNDVTKTL